MCFRLSLSIIILSFIHVGGINTLLHFTIRKQAIAWIHHNILFTHSPTADACSQTCLLQIMLLYMTMSFDFSWVRDWISGMAGTYGRCLYSIQKTIKLLSKVVQCYIPMSNVCAFQLLHILLITWYEQS